MRKGMSVQGYEYLIELIHFFRNAVISLFVVLALIAYKFYSINALHEVFVWVVAFIGFTVLSCIELTLYLFTKHSQAEQLKNEIDAIDKSFEKN